MGSFEIFKKLEMLSSCTYTVVNEEFMWMCKVARIAKTVLKKNKVVGLTLSDFKTIILQQVRDYIIYIKIENI